MNRVYVGAAPLSQRQRTRKLVNRARVGLQLCATDRARRFPWTAIADGTLAAVLGAAVGVIWVLI